MNRAPAYPAALLGTPSPYAHPVPYAGINTPVLISRPGSSLLGATLSAVGVGVAGAILGAVLPGVSAKQGFQYGAVGGAVLSLGSNLVRTEGQLRADLRRAVGPAVREVRRTQAAEAARRRDMGV